LIHTILHLGLLLLGFGVIKLVRVQGRGERAALTWAFVVAYLVRLNVIVLLHVFSRDGVFMLDDRGYDEQGRFIASVLPALHFADLPDQLGSQHVAYPLMVGLVYFIGGHSMLSAKLLNAFFGALLSPVIYWLASEIGWGDPGLPRRAAWLAALFPFDIAWAALLLRDTILELLFAALLLATVAALRRRSYLFLGLVLLLLCAINFFRFYAVFVWAGAATLAGVAWLARRVASRVRGNSWIYFCGITGGAILLFAVALPALVLQVQFVRGLLIQTASLSEASDVSLLTLAPSNDAVASLIHGVFVYMFAPFPWVFWGNNDPINYAFYPGMYAIYALFPFFMAGFWRMVRNLESVNVFLIGSFFLHAAIEIYVFQGAPRQRMMTDAVFILCSAAAWPLRQKLARKTKLVYVALILIALVHTLVRIFG
jgi:hypothetical protein